MIPAIWTSYFMELAPEAMVDSFAEAGWPQLELSDEHALALLERGDAPAVGEDFKRYAAGHGVAFPQGHLWLACDIAAPDQQPVIDGLRTWLDLFAALDVRAAVLHPGGKALLEQGCTAEALFEARVKALTALTEHVAGTPVTLCLENIPSKAPEAGDLCTLIEAVGGNHLGICLDTGHLNLASRDQGGFIRQAGRLLKALHIADNDTSSDQHLMPYGGGTVPWGEVVAALREIGYSGLFNLEIPGERNGPMPIKLAKLDYAKTLLAHLLGAR